MSHKPQGDPAFLFQGAGIELGKYIQSLDTSRSAVVKKYFGAVNNLLNLDLWNYLNGQPECGTLDDELLDQIAVYAIGCASHHILESRGIMPSVLLGYSMGIYTALVCGRALDFDSGLRLIVSAYTSMKSACGEFKGSMANIIGLQRSDVEGLLRSLCLDESVEIANENNRYSIVISGIRESIEQAVGAAREEGALKVVELKVTMPYHSRFVAQGADLFEDQVKLQKLDRMRIPLVSSIDQRMIEEPSEIACELHRNLKSNLSWRKSIEKTASMGIGRFIEVGAGDSLSRFSGFISPDLEFVACDKL